MPPCVLISRAPVQMSCLTVTCRWLQTSTVSGSSHEAMVGVGWFKRHFHSVPAFALYAVSSTQKWLNLLAKVSRRSTRSIEGITDVILRDDVPSLTDPRATCRSTSAQVLCDSVRSEALFLRSRPEHSASSDPQTPAEQKSTHNGRALCCSAAAAVWVRLNTRTVRLH